MIKQIKAFQANTPEKLTERVNEYLGKRRAPLVVDIKYALTWDENGVKHGALVITEEQEGVRIT